MNLLSFTAHFGSEEDCRRHFKSLRDLQGVFVPNVAVEIITGRKINGVANANLVNIAFH